MKKLLFLFILFFAIPVYGADFSFDISKNKSDQNNLYNVYFNLDTLDNNINAIEGKVLFDNSLLKIIKINYGNSPINFWVEEPKESQSGSISFSGIVPNGIPKGKYEIFNIVFYAKKSGQGEINLKDFRVLANDGEGSLISSKVKPLSFNVLESLGMDSLIYDDTAPEDFSVILSTSSSLFDGKYFISFLSQDKESGIEKYQVKEGFFGKFEDAKSPYLLKNQSLRKNIYVKAQDRNGNVRLVKFKAVYPLFANKKYIIIAIIVLLLIYALYKKKKYIS